MQLGYQVISHFFNWRLYEKHLVLNKDFMLQDLFRKKSQKISAKYK